MSTASAQDEDDLDDDGIAPSTPAADVRYPLSLPHHPLKRAVKLAAGHAFSRLQPFRCTELLAGQFEWPLSWKDRCILAWQGQQLEKAGRPEALEPVHRRFWAGPGGANLLSQADWRYRDMFLNHHHVIVPEIQRAIARLRCRTLVELGCGRGDVLAHLSRNLSGVKHFVGVDLSERMIADDRRRFSRAGLQFEAQDAVDWILQSGTPRLCAMSYGGVLEFLPRARLAQLFHYLGGLLQPSVYALVEPLADGHDLTADDFSHAWGDERSLSHNYPSLLRDAGFEITWQTQMRLGSQRWLLLVAESAGRPLHLV